MFLDSNLTVLTFLSWLDLLGVVLAFWISILKIFKLLPNYWHRVTDITSLEKYWESSSGHILSFYPYLVKYRSKNMFLKESLTRWSSLQTKEGQMRSEFRLVGLEHIQTPSTSKVFMTSGYREDDMHWAWPFYSLVQILHCILADRALGTTWRDLFKPLQKRQGPDLRPLWFYSGIL